MSELSGGWFEQSARCAEHPHAEASLACARCGAFCCESCSNDAWCQKCALLVIGDHVPLAARGVAWKLLLAPLFLLGSALVWAARGNELSFVSALWLVPVICAAIVLTRKSAAAAWVGAVGSLLLLAWQGLTLFTEGAEFRLIDVGLLAIAPVLALNGASRLGKLFDRQQVLRAAA
ncbi:MAG: B-box zinc finger protein [Myxococcaceae bacterium]